MRAASTDRAPVRFPSAKVETPTFRAPSAASSPGDSRLGDPGQNFDPKQSFGLRVTKLITDKLKLPYLKRPVERNVGGRPEVDYLS